MPTDISPHMTTIDPSTILSPTQMALLGSLARDAGFAPDDITALVGTVTEIARAAAEEAAIKATMAFLPKIFAGGQQIHRNAAMRVAQRISGAHRNVTTGLLNNHSLCVAAAHQVADEPAQRNLTA